MWPLLIFEMALVGYSYAYHRWGGANQRPAARPADISLPRVDFGAPVPLIYGKCLVRTPFLAYSGNNHIPEPDPGNTLYELDMMFVVGVPFYGGRATLGVANSMWAGDTRCGTLLDPTEGPGERQIFVMNTSGAPEDLSGFGEFFSGSPTQNVGDPGTRTRASMMLAGIDPTRIPGYRNQVVFSFVGQGTGAGMTLGRSPQVPAFGFEVSSLSTGTPADMGQSLDEDADPAAVIFDLLTSPWGKLGLPESKVDRASFEAASVVLFAEGHGYSRCFDQVDDAFTMIDDVLRQIDAVLYEEPTTGKFTLRLIRKDYNVGTLDDINPDNVSAISNYSAQGWSETPNQVRVTYTKRALVGRRSNYVEGLAIGQNEANAIAQGGKRRPVDIRYAGCCTDELAQKLASRELAVLSQPSVLLTVVVNRSFYEARPGDVFTFTWPELGINKMVMRVARVNLGQLHDGRISLDLMRDIFDASVGAYPVPVAA